MACSTNIIKPGVHHLTLSAWLLVLYIFHIVYDLQRPAQITGDVYFDNLIILQCSIGFAVLTQLS